VVFNIPLDTLYHLADETRSTLSVLLS